MSALGQQGAAPQAPHSTPQLPLEQIKQAERSRKTLLGYCTEHSRWPRWVVHGCWPSLANGVLPVSELVANTGISLVWREVNELDLEKKKSCAEAI